MNFGIPYMGNKSEIVKSLALNFPKAENFYDLFGGGFSVTHYMITNKSNSYEYFHYNELIPSTVELVKRAINGEFNYTKFKPEWISREDFFKRIDDPYVRIIWSFGNNQKDYLFGKDIESYKKSMHMAVVFDQFDETAKKVLGFNVWPKDVSTIRARRAYLAQKIKFDLKKNCKQLQQLQQLERLQQLEQLERLQQLERPQQLERLQQLQRLTLTSLDYREVEIKPNSVVYCDIPYKGTAEYIKEFDHKALFDWASPRPFPVYISEYHISDPRFKLVYSVKKSVKLSQTNQHKTSDDKEKLYWNGVILP